MIELWAALSIIERIGISVFATLVVIISLASRAEKIRAYRETDKFWADFEASQQREETQRMSAEDEIIEAGWRDGAPVKMRRKHAERILDIARFLNPRARFVTIDSEAIDPDIDWTASVVPADAYRKAAEKVRTE